MSSESISFETSNGATTAYVATPEQGGGKAVIVIQEWWGLNDHIKDIANRYAAEGFTAIAPDLYRGRVAANPDEASKLMHALEIEDGLDTIKNAISAASEKFGISHFGVTGYCMGGTFALRAACELEGSARLFRSTETSRAMRSCRSSPPRRSSSPAHAISGSTRRRWPDLRTRRNVSNYPCNPSSTTPTTPFSTTPALKCTMRLPPPMHGRRRSRSSMKSSK